MFRSLLLLLLLLWVQDIVWSVRLVELRVPAHAREGGSALLGCQYDLEGDKLYSVKWYKGTEEFYRYVPKNNPPNISFKRPGVTVNMTRSSDTIVALEDLTQESEGDYTCEVSGEAPSFTTVRSAKHIKVYLLPESGPHLSGLKDQYYLDELAVINCTSSASRPVAQLKWLVNEMPPSQYEVRGPWYSKPVERPEAAEITLQLRFKVAPRHFVDSAMRLKCQATIAPLYQREANSTHYIGLPFTLITEQTPFQLNAGLNHATDSSSNQYKIIQLLFTVMPILVLQIG